MLKKNKRKKKQASNKTSQTLNMYNSTRYASQETTGVFFFFWGGGVALCFSTLVFWESLLTHKSTSPLRELSLLQMVMLLLGLSNYSNH